MKKDKKYRRKIEALKAQIASEKPAKRVVDSVAVEKKEGVVSPKGGSPFGRRDVGDVEYIKKDLTKTAVLALVCFSLIGFSYFALGHLETIRGVLSLF